MQAVRYSVIVPVFNRPEELEELLASLVAQTFKDFEVLVVDDGSTRVSREVCDRYADRLKVRYFFKPNSGPGPSRNFGFGHADGTYFVMFDSDCIVPPSYFQTVEDALAASPFDAWGGPDRGHSDFTAVQQAMAYTMSSFLTTGGIRGGKNQADKFQPRSFNMGVHRKVVEATGGFKFDRSAEDIEWSIRIRQGGFVVRLLTEAFVYHKRRTSLSQFYRQVRQFGNGRAQVGLRHPGEIKPTHWFPTFFAMGILLLPVIAFVNPPLARTATMLYGVYLLAVAVDAIRATGSLAVGFWSVPSVLVQMFGYGTGFFLGLVRRQEAAN